MPGARFYIGFHSFKASRRGLSGAEDDDLERFRALRGADAAGEGLGELRVPHGGLRHLAALPRHRAPRPTPIYHIYRYGHSNIMDAYDGYIDLYHDYTAYRAYVQPGYGSRLQKGYVI